MKITPSSGTLVVRLAPAGSLGLGGALAASAATGTTGLHLVPAYTLTVKPWTRRALAGRMARVGQMWTACTLPTAERPLRLAKFDDLFATALRSTDRTSDTHARLLLAGDTGLAERTQRLAVAESSCCCFFTFTVTTLSDGQVAFESRSHRRTSTCWPPSLPRRERARGDVVTAPVNGPSGRRRGQVAAAADVNIETLRYYERRGLLAEPDRSRGGHRLYPSEAVTVLRVI